MMSTHFEMNPFALDGLLKRTFFAQKCLICFMFSSLLDDNSKTLITLMGILNTITNDAVHCRYPVEPIDLYYDFRGVDLFLICSFSFSFSLRYMLFKLV